MSTVVYRDAYVLIGGASLRASLNELALNFSAEMLDETAFGDDTRVRKGGLKMASAELGGHAESGDGMVETALFGHVGEDDVVVAIFPNGITEGSAGVGSGYAMRAVGADLTLGAAVGSLRPIRGTFEGRGVEA